MSTPNADAWELAGFPGRLDVAAYLTADQLAAQYRVLVDVLLDAQEHSLTGVGRDELLAAVRDRIADATDAMTAERLTRPEALDLDARMRALQDWKVVIRWQDKAKTEADFIRTRDRYQLTSEAADLHRWLRRKIDEDAVSTSAAAFAPAIIAERLDDTIDAIGQRDLGQAAQAWAQVRTTLKDMAEAASIWQSRMASALAGAPDADKMSRLRETLIAYVTVWGAGVDTYSPRIRDALSRLREIVTDDDWRAMALSGVDATAAEEIVQAIAQGNRDAADTLSVWFGDGPARRCACGGRYGTPSLPCCAGRGRCSPPAAASRAGRNCCAWPRRSSRRTVTPTHGRRGARPPVYGPLGMYPVSRTSQRCRPGPPSGRLRRHRWT